MLKLLRRSVARREEKKASVTALGGVEHSDGGVVVDGGGDAIGGEERVEGFAGPWVVPEEGSDVLVGAEAGVSHEGEGSSDGDGDHHHHHHHGTPSTMITSRIFKKGYQGVGSR